jgi:DNA-binding NtrC family response regulator
LAAHFLNKYNHKAGKLITGFSNKAIHRLKSYHWPGNIRELEHLIERHVLLTKGTIVTEIKIPTATKAMLSEKNEPVALRTLFESEREYIFSVLQHCNGRVSGPDGAAKILGVPATTLNSKIKKLGLTKTHMA